MVNTSLKNPLSNEQLEEIYYEKIKGHPGLKEDLAYYNRLDEHLDRPDRSYHYLFGIVEKFIQRTHRDNVKRSRDKERPWPHACRRRAWRSRHGTQK